MIPVTCDYCGKTTLKRPMDVRKHKHHFCCRAHNFKWMHENKVKQKSLDWTAYNKVKQLAEERKQIQREKRAHAQTKSI